MRRWGCSIRKGRTWLWLKSKSHKKHNKKLKRYKSTSRPTWSLINKPPPSARWKPSTPSLLTNNNSTPRPAPHKSNNNPSRTCWSNYNSSTYRMKKPSNKCQNNKNSTTHSCWPHWLVNSTAPPDKNRNNPTITIYSKLKLSKWFRSRRLTCYPLYKRSRSTTPSCKWRSPRGKARRWAGYRCGPNPSTPKKRSIPAFWRLAPFCWISFAT